MERPRPCSDSNWIYQGSATVVPEFLVFVLFGGGCLVLGFFCISTFWFCPFFTNDLELGLKVLEWIHRLAMILNVLLKKRFLVVWRFLFLFPFSLCYLLNPVNICPKLPLTSAQLVSCYILCVFLPGKTLTIVPGALPSIYVISLRLVCAKTILSYTSAKD